MKLLEDRCLVSLVCPDPVAYVWIHKKNGEVGYKTCVKHRVVRHNTASPWTDLHDEISANEFSVIEVLKS